MDAVLINDNNSIVEMEVCRIDEHMRTQQKKEGAKRSPTV